MECLTVRKALSNTNGSPGRGVLDHLDSCASCERYAARFETTRSYMQGHHARVEPGTDFAARVVTNLQRGPEALGWAALRLLPATLALALALLGWSLIDSTDYSELLGESAPSEDPIAWILEDVS